MARGIGAVLGSVFPTLAQLSRSASSVAWVRNGCILGKSGSLEEGRPPVRARGRPTQILIMAEHQPIRGVEGEVEVIADGKAIVWRQLAEFAGWGQGRADLLDRSKALAAVLGKDRVAGLVSLGDWAVGGMFRNATVSSRQVAWSDGIQRTVLDDVVERDRVPSLPQDRDLRVAWARPTWENTGPSAAMVKLRVAAEAERSGFDPGYHRAMKREKSELSLWVYRALQQAPVLHTSWLFEGVVRSLARSAIGGGHYPAEALELVSGGAGRASFIEQHPAGAAFITNGVLWGGDPAGWNARVPFVARSKKKGKATETGVEGASSSSKRGPLARASASKIAASEEESEDEGDDDSSTGSERPAEVRRVWMVPGEAVVDFSNSPALGSLSDASIFVSRARTRLEILEEIVVCGATASRGGVFPADDDVFIVLPLALADEVRAAFEAAGLRWRLGQGTPLEELARHILSCQEGGTLPGGGGAQAGMTRADVDGALRVLSEARGRFGGVSSPLGLEGLDVSFVGVLPQWWMRVASAMDLIGSELALLTLPEGAELATVLTVMAYQGREWAERATQRVCGSPKNIGLLPNGQSLKLILGAAMSSWSYCQPDGGWASAIPMVRVTAGVRADEALEIGFWGSYRAPIEPGPGTLWPSGDVVRLPTPSRRDHSAVPLEGAEAVGVRNLILRAWCRRDEVTQSGEIRGFRRKVWARGLYEGLGDWDSQAFEIPWELIQAVGGLLTLPEDIRLLTVVDPFFVSVASDPEPGPRLGDWDF